MIKKWFFLIVILLCTSCKVTKNITPTIPEMEIDNFNGSIKSVKVNTYVSTQKTPNTTFTKSDITKAYKTTYKQGYLGDEFTLNRIPNYEVIYNNKKEITYIKKFNLKDSIVNTSNFSYSKDKIIANTKTNKISVSTATTNSLNLKNGKKTLKVGKDISENKNVFFYTKRIYNFKNSKLTSIVYIQGNNDTISLTNQNYFKDGKLKSVNVVSNESALSEKTTIEYFKNGNLDNKIVTTENKAILSKSTETFDDNGFILKNDADAFFKKKRINGKSITEYFYKGKGKNKKLLKTVKTESFRNLQISKKTTYFFANGLEKGIEKEHIRNGSSSTKFEYDFDKHGNWTHKYYYDESKKGIIKAEVRKLEYF